MTDRTFAKGDRVAYTVMYGIKPDTRYVTEYGKITRIRPKDPARGDVATIAVETPSQPRAARYVERYVKDLKLAPAYSSLELSPDKAGLPLAMTPEEFYDQAMNAIDLASDQDQRTAITDGGKIIAWIVTAEDGERLTQLDGQLTEYRRVLADYHATRGDLPGSHDPLLEAAREARELNAPIEVTVVPEPPDTLQELREPE